MAVEHAPRAQAADPTRPSLAALPWEMQKAIFNAASGPQIFFLTIQVGLSNLPPAQKTISQTCRLAREAYTDGKVLVTIGRQKHWVDAKKDIFYFHADHRRLRGWNERARDLENLYVREEDYYRRIWNLEHMDTLASIDRSFMNNIAINLLRGLEYTQPGFHTRVIQDELKFLFPNIKNLDVYVPKGPVGTPVQPWTPETLVLENLPKTVMVAAPGHDRAFFYFVKNNLERKLMWYDWGLGEINNTSGEDSETVDGAPRKKKTENASEWNDDGTRRFYKHPTVCGYWASVNGVEGTLPPEPDNKPSANEES